MSECSQSFTLTEMWVDVSSCTPHLLHKGLLVSLIKWRFLITTLDCVLLKDKSLLFALELGPEINSRACLWVLPRHGSVVNCTLRPLYPCKITLGAHWIGGRVGPRGGLKVLEKNLMLMLGFEPRTLQHVAEVLRPADISQLVTYNCCSKHFVFWRSFRELRSRCAQQYTTSFEGPPLAVRV